MSSDVYFSYNDIMRTRVEFEKKLVEASIKTQEGTSSRLWIDAYSAQSQLTLKSDKSSVTANVTVVGGDFFLFHPMTFVSGHAFSPDDVMQDRMVIGEVTAWQLFGSNDVVGKTVYVGDTPFLIAGVVERQEGRLFEEAHGASPRIYMPLSVYTSIRGDIPITCYEAVLPNPISGFALTLVKDVITDEETEIIENSSRYNILNLYKSISALNTRSMKNHRIIYPYWENIAVVIEEYCIVILIVQTAAAVIFIITALCVVISFIRKHPLKNSKTLKTIGKKIDDFNYKRYIKRTAKKKIKKEKSP